jgi:hypothetical protein
VEFLPDGGHAVSIESGETMSRRPDDRAGIFFRRRAHQGGIAERKAMINREQDLSITSRRLL